MDASAIGQVSVIRRKAEDYGAHFFAVNGGVVAKGVSGTLQNFKTAAHHYVDDAAREFVEAFEGALLAVQRLAEAPKIVKGFVGVAEGRD